MVEATTPTWSYENSVRIPFVRLFMRKGKEYVEIPLLDAGRGIEGDATKYSVQPLYLIDFSIILRSPVYGGNHVTFTILDPVCDYFQKLLLDSESTAGQPGMFFRFGWRGRDDSQDASSLVSLYPMSYTIQIHPFRGAIISVDARDASHKLSSTTKTLAFGENERTSDVIKKVVGATDENMEVDIVDIPTPVGKNNKMENDKPLAYIRDLLHVSKGQNGESLYEMSVVAGESYGKTKLVIRPVEYKKPRDDAKTTYVYGRSKNGEMLNFTVTLHCKGLYMLGGSRLASVVVDPRLKVWKRAENNQDSDGVPSQQTARANKIPDDATNVVESAEDAEAAQNRAAACRGSVDMSGFTAEATVMGNTSLHPFDTINVVVLKSDPTAVSLENLTANDIHWFSSGIYLIWSVVHTIQGGTFHTKLEMFRNGGFEGFGHGGRKIPIKFDPVARDYNGKTVVRVQALQNPDSQNPSKSIVIPDGV